MKRKITILLLISLLFLTGCTKSAVINGKRIALDKKYNDGIISYLYPKEFEEIESDEGYTTLYERKNEYHYEEENEKTFIIRIEEYNISKSFKEYEQDIKNLESDDSNRYLKKEKIKAKNTELRKYTFVKSSEYGDDLSYHLYYGKFYATGLYKYIKIYFINTKGREDFEKEFISNVIIKP